jgi:GcrA cell cycle regulator
MFDQWTQDRSDLLIKLRGEGLSATEIAREMGGGITRNAVLGRAKRMGLAKPSGTKVRWTAELSERLEILFRQGLSFSQIALQLDAGASRDAAIARARLLGLSRDRIIRDPAPRPHKTTRITRTNGNSNTMRVTEGLVHDEPALRCVEIESRNLTVLDLKPGDCRYPHGEGSEIRMCGHPAIEGRSYCAPHLALCTGPKRTLSDRDYYLAKSKQREEQRESMGLAS